MKLIIPIEYYSKGGVERVIIGLLSNLLDQVEQIIFIASDKEIEYFKTILPTSEKLIYQSWQWPVNSATAKRISFLQKLLSISQKLKLNFLASKLTKTLKNIRRVSRINALIEQYQATHCLYVLINRIDPPNVKIPLYGIAHDLFWRFAPMTYPDDYIASFDHPLFLWLQQATLIFSVSEKTREDILTLFPEPQFSAKVKAIPWSGYPSHDTPSTPVTVTESSIPIFYFPSSFGIYKDQLTLLKAGIKVAQKNLAFKIIFIGRETDNLIQGKLSLSQQAKTQEYQSYLQECRDIYQQYQDLIPHYFLGLGYCDYETVEYYYAACSCVVFPSRYEGFGLAISEAIVRGLPVISSDLAVLKEQVDLYHCPDRVDFFPQGDASALATLLEQFILSPKPKLTPAEIQQRFSHWTWQEVAQAYFTELSKSR